MELWRARFRAFQALSVQNLTPKSFPNFPSHIPPLQPNRFASSSRRTPQKGHSGGCVLQQLSVPRFSSHQPHLAPHIGRVTRKPLLTTFSPTQPSTTVRPPSTPAWHLLVQPSESKMSGTPEHLHAHGGDLLRRAATQAMMSRYVLSFSVCSLMTNMECALHHCIPSFPSPWRCPFSGPSTPTYRHYTKSGRPYNAIVVACYRSILTLFSGPLASPSSTFGAF